MDDFLTSDQIFYELLLHFPNQCQWQAKPSQWSGFSNIPHNGFCLFTSHSVYLKINAHPPPLEVGLKADGSAVEPCRKAPKFNFHAVNFEALNKFFSETDWGGDLQNLSRSQAVYTFYGVLGKLLPFFVPTCAIIPCLSYKSYPYETTSFRWCRKLGQLCSLRAVH